MKKSMLALLLLLFILGSSQILKSGEPVPDIIVSNYCGTASVVELVEKDKSALGTVMVSNDEENLTLQVFAEEGLMLSDLKIYVGSYEEFPFNKPNNPKIGHFPYKAEFPNGEKEYSITIPLEELEENLIVSLKAEFNGSGTKGEGHHTAWCSGKEFNERGNWAMYFEYTLQACEEEE